MPPTVVVFDLMDTLLRDPYRDALEAGTGLSIQEILERKPAAAWPEFELGRITEEEYLAVFSEAGIDLDRERFHHARRHGYAWMPGMAELLARLEGEVHRVVASNYPVWIDEVAAEWLDGMVEDVVASCHLDARKPEPDFYDRLLARLQVEPDRVAFVDDRERNVEAAAEAGMVAHAFVDVASLTTWLRTLGIEV